MANETAKVFVGGISRETSEDDLKQHFEKYGAVEGCLVAKDRITKFSRGFGFVWFCDASSASKALQDSHVIHGRTVDVKKAIPKGEQYLCVQQPPQLEANGAMNTNSSNGNCEVKTKKIFVGGLAASVTEHQFRSYFEGFGRIVDVVVMQDRSTKRPRGFGFVTYESEVSVDKAMERSFHELQGKLVEVKRAVPKDGIFGTNSNNSFYRDEVKQSNDGYPQPGYYSTYDPRYEFPLGYAPFPGYFGVGGYVYGTGKYVFGYPMAISGHTAYPSFVPGNPWGGPLLIGNGSFGEVSFNDAYLNNGNFGHIQIGGYGASQGPVGIVKPNEVVGGNANPPDSNPQLVNGARS